MNLEALKSKMERLQQAGSWTCKACGREILGPPDPDEVCSVECINDLRDRWWRESPKDVVLRAAKVPEYYRLGFESDYHDEDLHDPRAPGENVMDWRGEGSVTLIGCNGSGKSMLAAELLYGLRSVARTMLWVRPAQIIAEDRDSPLGQPRCLFSTACTAEALVIDEFGHGHMNDHGLELLAELIETRWSARRSTIVTSHLHFSSNAGTPSVEGVSGAIFDRLQDGYVIGLPDRTGRGQNMSH